jgi:adenylate cyclase
MRFGGLALVAAIPEAGMPAARVALNAGPLVLRDADFYGRTVNIAARLIDYARPREVLVTETVVRASKKKDIRYEEIGPVSLKGVPDPVIVYTATAS